MSNITLYELPDFQGNETSIPPHEVVPIFIAKENLMYQSARLNGNKLMVSLWHLTFDPENYEEFFFSEDINNFIETFIEDRAVSLINVVNLNSDDIIVSMDVHQELRGFRGLIDCFTNLPNFNTRCFEDYTTNRTLCTAAILDTNTSSANFSFDTELSAQNVLAQNNSPYGTNVTCSVTYSAENGDISVEYTAKNYINMTTEKIDDNHFIIHTSVSTLPLHCLMHSEEEYQGYNAVLTDGQLFEWRNNFGQFDFKSMEIVSHTPYNVAWLWTYYPAGGSGYDFNQYRSYVATRSFPNFPALFGGNSSAAVNCIYNGSILPVFIRLNNIDTTANWKNFVVESAFSTELLSFIKYPYYSFCANNPAALQESLLCVIGEDGTDFSQCDLRYGTLSPDGSTATWNGETSILVETATSDELVLSLPSDAPSGWAISSITKDEDGWHVELTGSGS